MRANLPPPARLALLLSLVLTSACSIGENVIGLDAGTSIEDAGRADGGLSDGGIDAGTADAGPSDAGPADAGSCDQASCNDNDPCTADTCTASGCSHAPSSGQNCDDHSACTTADVCIEGLCVGTEPVVCPTPGVCEDQGVCDPLTGLCSEPFSELGTTCDDSSVATYNDACDGNGVCGGVTIFCPANTACLTYVPNGTATCTATTLDAVACNDGDACTRTDACEVGLCVGSNAVTCGTPGVCEEQGTCDSASGQCSHPSSPQGTDCDDGSLTTYNDGCDGHGVCGGTAVVCPTNAVCATYAPNGSSTCTVTFHNGTTCNDGDACTQTDACAQGSCVGSNPVSCGAPQVCHAQAVCEPSTGHCSTGSILTGTACNDGNLSTYNDTCNGSGTCVGTSVTCPADNACTSWTPNGSSSCAPTYHDGTACEDADPCTATGACHQGNCQLPMPAVCPMGLACADGACVCPAGWTGTDCTTDVDECVETPNICGGGSTCANTPGSYTCTCITNYSSPTGANCISSVAALELVIFYDDTMVQLFGAQTESRLVEIFTKTKELYDNSFPSQRLTLALNAMVRLSPFPSSIVKRACNTPDPSQPSCIGCWVNSTPANCSNPYSQSADEIDVDRLLSTLQTYTHTTRANAIQSLSGGMDVPVLLTTDDFPSSIIGLGSVGAACNSYSGVVVQAVSSDTFETALTLAHEIGHNLNMSHDASGAPHIMAPSLDTANTTFSSASVNSYTSWRSTLGARNCISDPAQDDWRSHACGNGKIDPGESCDPGVEPDSCCDSSCHLKPGCLCGSTEPCCSNGLPKGAGTSCRASAGECDLADTCDGLSGACLDTFKAPGATCLNSGYCLNKQCASRNLQCSTINGGYYPNSTGCATTTDCSVLECNVNFTCDVSWLAPPDNGSSCGAGKQCSNGACVSSTQLATYAWAPGAWSTCAEGLSTRTLSCVNQTRAVVSSDACDPGLAPATSRACTQ